MSSKKSETTKGEKLTLKQKKLVEALPKSSSVAEAGERAGYYDRKTAHRALKSVSRTRAGSPREAWPHH